MEFTHETAAQARETIERTYPAFVDSTAGGPPTLPAGQRILSYETPEVAAVSLPNGAKAVIESTLPMATRSGSGGWAPVDLALRPAGQAFEASNPLVPVRLPKHLSEGVQLPTAGLSVTPVGPDGAQLGGSEAAVGEATAFFANTQPDTDTVLKPTDRGLDVSSALRSAEAPEQLSYRVDLPAGASLVAEPQASTPVLIEKEGTTIGAVTAPHAIDATGRIVPTAISVSGNVVTVTVAHHSGSYQYPILVDPEFWTVWTNITPGDWEFHEFSGYTYGKSSSELWMKHTGSYAQTDWAGWTTWTKGHTEIYEMYVKDDMYPTYSGAETEFREETFPFQSGLIEIGNAQSTERRYTPITPPYRTEATVCVTAACQFQGTWLGNKESFVISTTQAGSTPFGGSVSQVSTAIGEEKGLHATAGYEEMNPWLTVGSPPWKTTNILHAGAEDPWLGTRHGAFEYEARDEGLGVAESKVEFLNNGTWERVGGTNFQENGQCLGVECPLYELESNTYQALRTAAGKPLPDGEDKIRVAARSPEPYTTSTEYSNTTERTIDVDGTPPQIARVMGLPQHAKELHATETETQFRAEVLDGEGTTRSSGISAVKLFIDDHEIPSSQTGYCPAGPCRTITEWFFNGAEIGVGRHELTVEAEDRAGNVSTATYVLYVSSATPIAVGPGSVNPQSGDFALEATDVAFSGGMGQTLEVTRHYDSRNTKEGEGGPLGPQWTIGLGPLAQLEVLPDGSAMVIGPDGLVHFATISGGGFEAPEGDHNLSLEYLKELEGRGPAYVLKDTKQNTQTIFRLPSGATTWLPSVSEGQFATDTVTDEYQTVEAGGQKIVQPTLELAPHPAVTCQRGKMEPGCRALEFVYQGGETTAQGESASEWGAYAHQLKEVVAVAYNPKTKAMAGVPEAAYLYDAHGRLRAEWNPSVSPALKTTYGYDSEGHVTALTPAGQQTWAFTYGTRGYDPSTGRLLKVYRPPTTVGVWKGSPPSNGEAPKITGSGVAGVRLAVSNGTWNNEPISYAYQWERSSGTSFSPIPGATNANYTPTISEAYGEVRARVTALNGGGGVAATSAAVKLATEGSKTEGELHAPEPGTTIEYQAPVPGGNGLNDMTASEVAKWGQTDAPEEATAIFPPSKPMGWPATEYAAATVYYFDANANTVNVASPTGGVSTTEYNGSTGQVKRKLSAANRAIALQEANPVAAAEALDTKYAYNAEGELTDTWGPQHKVKLSSGQEIMARSHLRDFYDEGAPSGEHPGLVTRTTDGAEYEGKEADVRTTLTSYSGQEGFGWKHHVPTSTTTDPSGLDLVHSTIYDPNTGHIVETRSPSANAEAIYPPAFSLSFGAEGTNNGQFKRPAGLAIAPSGALWVVDRENNRIQKVSGSGTWEATYGKAGSGEVQFKKPRAIAINSSSGYVYIADTGNNRIEVLNASGGYVTSLGVGGASPLKEPEGVAVDPSGDVFAIDSGHSRVVEFNPEGAVAREFGGTGAGSCELHRPQGAVFSEGTVDVVDSGDDRVVQFSSTGACLNQFGSKGSGAGQFNEPGEIAANPSTGVLYVSDRGNYRIQEFSGSGRNLASWETWGPTHPLSGPIGVAVAGTGTLFVSDESAKISAWTPPEAGAAPLTYATHIGEYGSGPGQFSVPIDLAFDGEGNFFVTDLGHDRVEKFSAKGTYLNSFGSEGSGEGQFYGPGGIAVNQSAGYIYVADTYGARIEQFSLSTEKFIRAFGTAGEGKLSKPGSIALDTAGDVWVPDMNLDKVFEYSSTGTFIAAYGKEGSGTEGVQLKKPIAVAFTGETLAIADSANHRIVEMTTKGALVRTFAIEGPRSGELYDPEGIAADAAGHLYAVDDVEGHVEEFTAAGKYMSTYGGAGSGESQLKNPTGVTIDAQGDMDVVDTENNRVQKWTINNPAVHYAQDIYYSAKEEASVAACRNHPEWVGLLCQTQPAAQPKTTGVPALAETLVTYNFWNQIETKTETFGSVTRTTKTVFDGAGRPTSTEETAAGRSKTEEEAEPALPKVTDHYNAETGAVDEESDTVGSTTKTIKHTLNTLGQLETYTDTDGNLAKYSYDIDGRVSELTDGSEAGLGKQTYHYDETTGELTSLTDHGAGTFTATYTPGGRIATESFPNGMTAYYTYDATGEKTGIEYKKITHCTEKCTWYSDTIVPSVHGEPLKQTSTLSEEPSYAWNAAGQMTEVEEKPAGEGCTTRIYAYNEEGNRTGFTVRPPGSEGKCATEGGTTTHHLYDSADRLIDPGVTYDAFGNIVSLPAADAGGPEGGSELLSSYYIDGQAAKQSQAGKTIEYKLDPEDRPRETITTGTVNQTVVSHYDGAGAGAAWASEAGGKWTRYVPGIGGELVATTTNAGTELQLHDLQGDIVATAAISETATKLTSTYNPTEFGVPRTSAAPPAFAWLGEQGISSELPSGIVTQDGRVYVPLTGQGMQAKVEPPLPDNQFNAFTGQWPEGAAEADAAAAAQMTAESEERERQRQQAGQPAGCNVQTEGCAPDPEHGRNEFGCKVTAKWGVEIEVQAEFECRLEPSNVQMQVEEWRVENGKYVEVYLKEKAFEWRRNGRFDTETDGCHAGDWYRAWVFASTWAFGNFIWSDAFVLHNNTQCYLADQPVVEDPIEGDPSPTGPEYDGGGGADGD
jgi:tripartite motif-containing protein 71